MVGLKLLFFLKINIMCNAIDICLPSVSDRSFFFFLIVLLNCPSVLISFSFLSTCVHILGPKTLIECLSYVMVL